MELVFKKRADDFPIIHQINKSLDHLLEGEYDRLDHISVSTSEMNELFQVYNTAYKATDFPLTCISSKMYEDQLFFRGIPIKLEKLDIPLEQVQFDPYKQVMLDPYKS